MTASGSTKHGLVGMTKTLAVDLAKYQINVKATISAAVDKFRQLKAVPFFHGKFCS